MDKKTRTPCAWAGDIPLIGVANGDGPGLFDTPEARAIDAAMTRAFRRRRPAAGDDGDGARRA